MLASAFEIPPDGQIGKAGPGAPVYPPGHAGNPPGRSDPGQGLAGARKSGQALLHHRRLGGSGSKAQKISFFSHFQILLLTE